MKELEYISMSKKRYDEVIEYASEFTSQRFCYLNLSEDLASYLMARLIKSPALTDPIGFPADFIESVLPRALEDVFNYYHRISFQFCLAKTQDLSLSEDISQEVIKQMLSSKNEIKNVSTWIRQVTHNLLCKHYQFIAKERELYSMLCAELTTLQSIMTSENTNNIEGLNPQAQKEIIASKEYRDYSAILTFDSIKDYASSLHISEKVAQKRKDKAIRNLRSKILLAIGWEVSRKILNYNQYNAIQKFIRTLLKAGHSAGNTQLKRKIDPKLAQVMKGIERIDDWGITMMDNCRFRLHIFHLSHDKQPILITFFIVLNERNHVRVENCKKNEFIEAHPIPSKLQIPKEMGRSLWTYEKIISMMK